jgi:hypothetical protein
MRYWTKWFWAKRVAAGILSVALVPAVSRAASDPAISAGSVSAPAGSSAVFPVTLSSSRQAPVASLQFSVGLPNGWTIKSVDPGPAAQSAGKSVSFGAANGKVILFGLDQSAIGAGVVALVSVQIPKEAATGKITIPLKETIFSNSAGVSIRAGKPGNGSITVLSAVTP